MTQLKEFLSNITFVFKHLSILVKLSILIVSAISAAAVGVAMFGSHEAQAVRKDLIQMRNDDMRRIETKLDKIENDAEFIKRFLIENRSK